MESYPDGAPTYCPLTGNVANQAAERFEMDPAIVAAAIAEDR